MQVWKIMLFLAYVRIGCRMERRRRKKKHNDGEKSKHLVLEACTGELGAGRIMITNNEGSSDYDEVAISGNKKKSNKKAFDNCEFGKDGCETRKESKKSLSVEDETAAGHDSSEMPFYTIANDKKQKKNKEKKDKKGDNQTAKGPSKNEVNVEDKMKGKTIQAAEAEGNREMPSMRKEKGTDDSEASNSKKKKKSTKDGSNTSALKKKKKKVGFSSEVEVFSVGNETQNEKDTEKPLVQGKRFTPEEDNKLMEAIDQYIQELVYLISLMAVYYRAHVLLERSEKRKWEPEEYDILQRFYATHGADWKTLAVLLGKHWIHLKDCWRRIKSPNFKKGAWSQDECQTLFDLVNMDLRMKASEEKKTKHGMLRDNISWEAISEKLTTRCDAACCVKWLQKVDACSPEDVDWDHLLEHRSGEICRERWSQMARHIGGYKEMPFIEQVEVLV